MTQQTIVKGDSLQRIERFVFAEIHHSFKVAAVHVRKGGRTDEILTRFRLGPGDSPTGAEVEDDLAAHARYLPVPVARIHRFSPRTTALLEVRSQRALAIVEKLYENGMLLVEQQPKGWGISYGREFHMTDDSKLFLPRPQWEAQGYRADEYGHWLNGTWRDGDGCGSDGTRDWSIVRSADDKSSIAVDDIEDVALPLYQGILINQLDCSSKYWLRGTGVRATWETIRALQDIRFELKRGDVLGLIGVNRSGKTTLLRLLAVIFPPDSGEIRIAGRVGALIALGAGFHPYFSGRENIYLNGALLGLDRDELDAQFDELVEFSEIGDFIDAPVASYTSGMRVRLGFSVAMAMRPDLLLIDEVLAVGDLGFKVKCLNKINELMKNAAVIFVSHSMQFVYRICREIMVLNKGTIAHHGRDVQEGIDYYHAQFNLAETRVSGSGKVTIADVHLHSTAAAEGGNGRVILNHGEDLVFKMSMTINTPVNKPVILIVAAQTSSNAKDVKRASPLPSASREPEQGTGRPRTVHV